MQASKGFAFPSHSEFQLDDIRRAALNRFSKLFMTHLQAEFSKQADPRVKTLISDQVSPSSAQDSTLRLMSS